MHIFNYVCFQIITDYQGFLNKFHERSSRHIGSHSANRNQNIAAPVRKQESKGTSSRATSYQNVRLNVGNTVSRYTNLTNIPETSFTCNGRRGLFADVETNCQVSISLCRWVQLFGSPKRLLNLDFDHYHFSKVIAYISCFS